MPRARVGVVLPMSADAAAEIDGLRRALGHTALGLVGSHLTLAGPVNVRVADLDGVLDAVRDAAARTPPIRLVLGPPATFWPTTPVVYLSVAGELDVLDRVRAAVSAGPLARPPAWPRARRSPSISAAAASGTGSTTPTRARGTARQPSR